MSGILLDQQIKHPEGVSLSAALREDEDRQKAQRKAGIHKQATLIKAPETKAPEATSGGPMKPTKEQIARINKFTRTPKTEDEVVCFSTLSMNDMEDRDEDRFVTECVQEFAELPSPYSPVGKSYMLDHVYKVENAVGRIFGVGVEKVEGATFLTNEVFIPNTERYAGLIEDIDFGINWAVSVGVTLGKSSCSVCEGSFSSWGIWCVNGHDKGAYYLKDGETDSFGFPLPVDSRTKGAIKCIRNFSDPRDFYELSQVFLGAQYDAQIDKGVLALAKKAGVPTLGLSAAEAKTLPLRHEPDRLVKARQAGVKIVEGDDGVLTWKDADNFVWVFDPQEPKSGVLAMGKSNDSNNEEDTEDGQELEQLLQGDDDLHQVEPEDAPVAEAGDGDGAEDRAALDGAERVGGERSPEGSVATSAAEEDDEDELEDDDEDALEAEDDNEEEDKMTRESVLASARKARLPQDAIQAAEKGSGTGLDALLLAVSKRLRQTTKTAEGLKAKAALGDEYVEDLRKQALAMHIKAHQEGSTPVDVSLFEKTLERIGDDPELLKGFIDRDRAIAEQKFGKSVRRSSFPTDVHDRPEVAQPAVDVSSTKVSRLHSR